MYITRGLGYVDLMDVDDAVAQVVAAWNDAGSHPVYHYRHKNLLRTNWSILASALDNLAAAKKEQP